MASSNSIHKHARLILLYYVLLAVFLFTTAMHIPDGYLSPVTSIIMFALVLPFWARGVKKLREKMNAKTAPMVALFAAFSFIIMLFNVPLPGGTTGHAVGGAIIAIILGPDIASIAISIALLIQALFFGDGGILTFGANCFNMAVVLPYVSYAIYHALTKKLPSDSKHRLWASALAAWAGLTMAAFTAAVEFGIQPALFHTADGTPLYAPYPLSISIPAMVVPHALIASVVEALVTTAILAYLMRANPSALQIDQKVTPSFDAGSFPRWRPLWITLTVLVLLTPIGLLAPGTAWGEWGVEELASLGIKSIPIGMTKLADLWSAPMSDYNVITLGNSSVAYVLSALVGILIITLVVWLFVTLITGGKRTSTNIVTQDK